MARFVSFNYKYYKHSNKNELSHNTRKHKNIDNIRPELSHRNFTMGNTESLYDKVYSRVTERKGKSIQKNANTYIDGVLAFSREQMDFLLGKFGEDKTKKFLDRQIKEYMSMLKDEFGFEPVSYDFHMDEGHYDKKSGEWQPNYHAHIIMFNYDFKKDEAPLRKMMGKSGKRKLSIMQDLAGQAFKKGGFVRGVSSEVTQRKHLERDEFIAKKQAAIIAELDNARTYVSEVISQANNLYDSLDEWIDKEKDEQLGWIKKLADATARGISADKDLAQIVSDIEAQTALDADLKASMDSFISNLPEDLYKRLYDHISSASARTNDNSFKNSSLPEPIKELEELSKNISKPIDRPVLKY
jgi:hypothetical protein